MTPRFIPLKYAHIRALYIRPFSLRNTLEDSEIITSKNLQNGDYQNCLKNFDYKFIKKEKMNRQSPFTRLELHKNL